MLRKTTPPPAPVSHVDPLTAPRQDSEQTVKALKRLREQELSAAELASCEALVQLGRYAGRLHANQLKAGRLTRDLTGFPQAETEQEGVRAGLWQRLRRAYVQAYTSARAGEGV